MPRQILKLSQIWYTRDLCFSYRWWLLKCCGIPSHVDCYIGTGVWELAAFPQRTPSSGYTLQMEASSSSETSARFYQRTRRHIPRDGDPPLATYVERRIRTALKTWPCVVPAWQSHCDTSHVGRWNTGVRSACTWRRQRRENWELAGKSIPHRRRNARCNSVAFRTGFPEHGLQNVSLWAKLSWWPLWAVSDRLLL